MGLDDDERQQEADDRLVADRLYVQRTLDYHQRHPEASAINGAIARLRQIYGILERIAVAVGIVAIVICLVIGNDTLALAIGFAILFYLVPLRRVRSIMLTGGRPTWR